MGLWQSLVDALPWNQRQIREKHAARERELQESAPDPLPPVASAAEAMADMRRRSAATAPADPEPPPEEGPTDGATTRTLPGSGRSGNEALRDFARRKGA